MIVRTLVVYIGLIEDDLARKFGIYIVHDYEDFQGSCVHRSH